MTRLEPHCMKKHEYDFQHRCPLWVISGHRATSSSRPLFPSKRTFIVVGLHVRLVPIADIAVVLKSSGLSIRKPVH